MQRIIKSGDDKIVKKLKANQKKTLTCCCCIGKYAKGMLWLNMFIVLGAGDTVMPLA